MIEVKVRKKSEVNKVYRADNALFLEQEAGIIRLVPQTDDVIRISYTENGIFSPEQGKSLRICPATVGGNIRKTVRKSVF